MFSIWSGECVFYWFVFLFPFRGMLSIRFRREEKEHQIPPIFPIHFSLMYLLQFHYVNILTHSHTQNTNHNLAKFSPINKCDKQTLSSLQCRSSDVSIWSIKCAQRYSHLFSDEAAFKIHDINHYQINDIICDGKTKTTRCA